MAKVCLLLLSLWCSAHLTGAIQTKKAPVATAANTTSSMITMATPTNQQIPSYQAGAELRQAAKDFGKAWEAAMIGDFRVGAVEGAEVGARLWQIPFHAAFQAYLGSLSKEKMELDDLAQGAATASESFWGLVSELGQASHEYQNTLAALAITHDETLLWPLIELFKKKVILEHMVAETKNIMDTAGFVYDQKKHRIDAKDFVVPLARVVSWSPTIFGGLSKAALELAQKVDHALNKNLDIQSEIYKSYFSSYSHLKGMISSETAPVTMAANTTSSMFTMATPTNQHISKDISPESYQAGAELRQAVKDLAKAWEAATIGDFRVGVVEGAEVGARLWQKKLDSVFQAYLASLSKEKMELGDFAQGNKAEHESVVGLVSQRDQAKEAYQNTLAAFAITHDEKLILPLCEFHEMWMSLQYAVDQGSHIMDVADLVYNEKKRRIDSKDSGLPLARVVSWSPTTFADLSEVALELAKKVDHELHNLVEFEKQHFTQSLSSYLHLKDIISSVEKGSGKV